MSVCLRFVSAPSCWRSETSMAKLAEDAILPRLRLSWRPSCSTSS